MISTSSSYQRQDTKIIEADRYANLYASSHFVLDDPIEILENYGLLARLEKLNATIEPKGEIVIVTIPGRQPLQFGRHYFYDAAIKLEQILNG